MTKQEFAPKDAETLQTEVLEDLGLEYGGNEEMVDKIVDRHLKDEAFKASLHEQKEKRGEKITGYKKKFKEAGFDPETGKKAEPKGSELKDVEKTTKNELSPKDYLALVESKVSSEDFDEVMRLSGVLGKGVMETLKDKTAQLILKERAEERASAETASTETSRRRSGQSHGNKLMGDLQSGKVPQTEGENETLAKAQFEQLLKRD